MGRTIGAVGVLQTEAGFVTFSDLGSVQGQEVVVSEHLNTVVVSVRMRMRKRRRQKKKRKRRTREEKKEEGEEDEKEKEDEED